MVKILLNGQRNIKKYIDGLNKKKNEQNRDVLVKYNQSKQIDKNIQRSFNGGYLFLQQIYHALRLHKVCHDISDHRPL